MIPNVSIIIPTLNEESVIGQTLAHLRDSLPRDAYEILVVDDESTDRTVDIAQRYADQVIVRTGEVHGIARGKNAGAKRARGEFVVFLDADCEPEKPAEFFEKAFVLFDADPRIVGLNCSLKVFPHLATRMDRIVFAGVNLTFRYMNNVLRIGGSSGEFQMVRRSTFETIHGFNENLAVAEDQDLFWRLTKLGRVRMEPSLIVWHTSRRAHKIGWPRLLMHWWLNYLSLVIFRKSAFKEWKVVR